jgi:diaminopimelate decarboxylase
VVGFGAAHRGRVVEVGGLDVAEIARRFGTPAYVLDEADFRGRAVAFRDAFAAAFADLGGADVYYAGKAFLCTAVARWVAADGLGLDVCTGGELAVALRAGVPVERIALHGNNKSDDELSRALDADGAGIGRIVVDNLEEIDRIADLAAGPGSRAPVMLRVTVGRGGAHPRVHRHRARGPEVRLSIAGGMAAEAVRRVLARPELELLGLHSHIGSQIFDTGGFEVAARRVLALHAAVAREHDVRMPGARPGAAASASPTPASTTR